MLTCTDGSKVPHWLGTQQPDNDDWETKSQDVFSDLTAVRQTTEGLDHP